MRVQHDELMHGARSGLNLETALKKRGLRLKLEVFEGIIVDGSECERSSCTHGPGPVKGIDVAKKELKHEIGERQCRLSLGRRHVVAVPELIALDFLTEVVTPVERRPELLLLNGSSTKWSTKWESITEVVDQKLTFEETHKIWLEGQISKNKSHLLKTLASNLEKTGQYRMGKPVPDRMMLVTALYQVQPLPATDFISMHYGSTGLPGVLQVPERFIQVITKAEFERKFSGPRPTTSGEEADETCWMLGSTPCQEPVRVSAALTPEIISTASVLMENLTLKEALQAAAAV